MVPAVSHLLFINSASKLKGSMGATAKWALDLLAWAEASHLHAIITELVLKRPDCLGIPEFRGELSSLAGSMNYLASIGDHHPYFQLIDEPSSSRPIFSRNFRVMTAVAWKLQDISAGRDKKSKASNYKGVALSETHPQVVDALARITQLYTVTTKTEEDLYHRVFSEQKAAKVEEIFNKVQQIEDED